MNEQSLIETAKKLVADDKGLLAMDESTPTCNKRFAKLGIPQTESARRGYRDLIVTTPDLGGCINGAILYDETIRQKNELDNMDIAMVSPKIINGSLIKANGNYFFLSIALEKINVDGVPVIVFSPQSPLGKKMTGLRAGDSLEMNGIHYVIEEVK